MSVSAPLIGPNLAGIFTRSSRSSSAPSVELNTLLERIRETLYGENVPVVASWWLKTVYFAGHNRAWWGELDLAIERVLRNTSLDDTAGEAIRDIQTWVRRAVLPLHKTPEGRSLIAPPYRDLAPDRAAQYLSRLLNAWLPAEVASVLTSESELTGSDEDGMPALAVAKALERLLVREHFSPATLELLLDAVGVSPKYVYPAHLEIFRNIILNLLNRTAAPSQPILPATHLGGGFADAVERALLVGDELQVPIDPTQALELLKHDPVRIGSVIATMDGRWWQSTRLQSGPGSVVVYRPGGRLRIDFAAEHARLAVPWPNSEGNWAGMVHLPDRIALFGREWRCRAWERSADQTSLSLEFAGVLAIPEDVDRDDSRPRRLRPASLEIAWSEVEQALATGVLESIDQLRRTDLIPLAHALKRMADCLLRPWAPSRSDVERSLGSVRYLHAAVAAEYGRIPWRVLSVPARTALFKAYVSYCTSFRLYDGESRLLRPAASVSLENRALFQRFV